MRPYLIYAPRYTHRSAGIRAMYTLRDELVKRGAAVTLFDWSSDAPPPVGTDAIVIYPEVVSGNPLKAERVVRWVCNKPGLLGGDAEYDENEFVFAWHESFFTGAPLLTVQTIDRSLFYVDGVPKVHDAYYVGKAAFRGLTDCKPPSSDLPMVEITRRRPRTREELAGVLRGTRTLYTFDDCTALIDEALLCGCRVVVLPESVEEQRDFVPDSVHAARIDAFVAATQARWGTAFDFVVIDYRCPEDIARLRTEIDETFPYSHTVTVIDNSIENRGFAKAANLGARAGTGDVVAFLNPDLHLAPGWADATATALEDPHVAIAGPRLDDALPWPRNTANWGVRDWVCGACFFVRRSIFEAVGGFDERFFFTFEETDLIRQVEQAGFRVVTTDVERPRIKHVRHATEFHQQQARAGKRLYREKWSRPVVVPPALRNLLPDAPDVVYICRGGPNEELRYSLRSLENFEHGRVWLFGGAPDWYVGDHVTAPQTSGKYENAQRALMTACTHSDVSDPFILMNDDFIAVEHTSVELFDRGPLRESIVDQERRHPRSSYTRRLKMTLEYLESRGIQEPISFELHVPMPVRKEPMREALTIAMQHNSELLHRSIYGVLAGDASTTMADVKISGRPEDELIAGPWLSTDDALLCLVRSRLDRLFPVPSSYERSGWMKVRVVRNFRDRVAQVRRHVGDEFVADAARVDAINSTRFGQLVEIVALEVPAPAPEPVHDEADEPEPTPVAQTVKDIKAILDARGIEYRGNAKKAELLKLL